MTSLSSLGLSPRVVTKLSEADFLLSTDVFSFKPTELSAATQLTLKESTEVIRLASSKSTSLLSQVNNLKDLVEKDEVQHIVTFCQSIDELFGGGIPLQAITEISGMPGVGKTQMCLQACISVQLPERAGGVDGKAVFIDTEGSFNVLRLKEMAEWAEKHVKEVHFNDSKCEFNTENILKGVYYFRCHSHLELLAVIKHLSHFLNDHGKVRLIVIDSIAFHFRHDFPDMKARTSLLCSITQDLLQQASKHKLAAGLYQVSGRKVTRFFEEDTMSHAIHIGSDGYENLDWHVSSWDRRICQKFQSIARAPAKKVKTQSFFDIRALLILIPSLLKARLSIPVVFCLEIIRIGNIPNRLGVKYLVLVPF